jgi:CrcB protein
VRVLAQIALVALGSALGGLTRWGVGLAALRLLGKAFPYGTLLINVTGSLFLGWLATYLAGKLAPEQPPRLREDLWLLLGTGFTGAYTTFSTFEYEAHGLFAEGRGAAGAAYLLLSVALGFAAVRLGVLLAR